MFVTKTINLPLRKLNISNQLLGSEYDDFVTYLHDLAFKNYMNYQEYEEYSTGIKREFLHPHQYMEVWVGGAA